MKRVLLAGVALVAVSFMATPAAADLSVHDRTLRITETDLGYSGGLEPRLERVYRSDSTHMGLFGRGWGSRYETRLEPLADGGLVVHENGCGPAVAFHPVPGRTGLWEARGCGLQRIKAVPTGFQRQLADGTSETFSQDGRLRRIADTNGNWVAVRYGQGRITAIEDNFGRTLAFAYGADGRIEQIRGENGRDVRYRHDAGGRVTEVAGSQGGDHRYTYGEDGLLISGAKATATYESGHLTSLDENGTIRRFGGQDGKGWRESWEVVQDSEGHRLSLTRRIQLFRTDTQGRNRLWREMSNRDGQETDIEYNDLGQAAIIRHGNGRSSGLRYDAMGRLLHKDAPGEALDMAYDPRSGKVSRVERRTGDTTSWSRFAYDARGNLTAAANSDGRAIALVYDPHGRIASITEGSKRLTFTYNRESRPIRIAVRGGGAIQVEYDDKGEIASVKSGSGAATALKVTAMFQGLLELVRQANIKAGL